MKLILQRLGQMVSSLAFSLGNYPNDLVVLHLRAETAIFENACPLPITFSKSPNINHPYPSGNGLSNISVSAFHQHAGLSYESRAQPAHVPGQYSVPPLSQQKHKAKTNFGLFGFVVGN